MTRRTCIVLALASLAACGKQDSSPAAGSGYVTPAAPVPVPVALPDAAPPPPDAAAAATTDGADQVAQLVVAAVASKALGSQTIEASCVTVNIIPAGDWTVAAARLKNCGDKTARTILWLFKRSRNGAWSEDFAGQPPKCWQNVPADIAEAVAKASKIPNC